MTGRARIDRDARILLGTDPATEEEMKAALAGPAAAMLHVGIVGEADLERWKAPKAPVGHPPASASTAAADQRAVKKAARAEMFRGMTKEARDALISEILEVEPLHAVPAAGVDDDESAWGLEYDDDAEVA